MEPYAVAGLSVITLLIVMALAIRSKAKTEERMENPDADKSSLAADGDPHQVAD